MDPRFQTSFIPKKPIVSQPGRVSSPINLFSLLAVVVFIVALVLAGGVFFYKQYVEKQIEAKKVSFANAKNDFEPDTINTIVRLNTRLEEGNKLLNNHIAVTPLFKLISEITLKNVRFKDFNYVYLAKDKIQVQMKGQTQSYASVALQSDLLNQQKLLKNTIVSDMALEAAGTVSFSVSTTVDPNIFLYGPSVGVVPAEAKAKPVATTTPKQ